MDGPDFNPAAFGLPTGFGGGKSKATSSQSTASKQPKQASNKGKKRVDENDTITTGPARGPIDSSEQVADDTADDQPQAGPSSLASTSNPRQVGTAVQEASNGNGGSEDAEDDQDGEEEGNTAEDDLEYFPISHEAILKDHTKAVSALSIDPSGSRIVSASYDYDVKLWDFGGMQSDFRPFKSFEPFQNYHLHDVCWNDNGTMFIVVAGTLQARVYDRDGNQIYETTKGDMYIRDLKNTSGHTGQLTSACWSPSNPNQFLTSSYDSTLRIWDLTEKFKSVKTIILKSKEKGGKTKITKATWSNDGKYIVAAAMDGTINMWNANSNFVRPNSVAENAHEKGTETSDVSFSLDNRTLVSRGGDGTVKLWDIKSLKKPIAIATNLPSLNPETSAIFSPDQKYILTGTSGPIAGNVPGKEVDVRGKEGGRIIVMKREDLSIVRELNISKGSVIKLLWPSRINQIIASTSLGEIHVLYSPSLSEKGATMAASRAPKARHALDDYVPGDRPILTPHALPMFKDDHYDVSDKGTAMKRKRDMVEVSSNGNTGLMSKKQLLKARKPEPPVRGPGSGGRVGQATDRHLVMGNIEGEDIRSQDPREALLKYATKEGEENMWTKAWGKHQKTVYDNTPEPEKEK